MVLYDDADVREPSASLSPEYDSTKVAAYVSSRMPACYAVLYRVFDELHLHLPDFKPRTMLDFGSGPGTAIWAAREARLWSLLSLSPECNHACEWRPCKSVCNELRLSDISKWCSGPSVQCRLQNNLNAVIDQ